jgi:hypothetical protein
MSARLNMNPIKPVLWKGRTFNQIVSGLKMNGSTESTGIFSALPMKHYRREVASVVLTDHNSRTSMSVDESLRPGGAIRTDAGTETGFCQTLDFSVVLPNDQTEQPATTSCSIRADDARRRVRSAGNARRPGSKYNADFNQYLVNRQRTFDQSQSHHFKTGDSSVTSAQNVYTPNGINACANPDDPSNFVKAYYKPSNAKFATQGGVSSGARLDRLKYDAIKQAQNSYKVSIAQPVGLSLKDKTGYPNGRCNLKGCCSVTSITGVIVDDSFTPDGIYSQYNNGFPITWDPISNGTVYSITQENINLQTFVLLTPTSGILYTFNEYDPNTQIDNYWNIITVHAHISGCPDVTGSSTAPCFFHDAIVTMADGTTKAIEDVRVGDMILGAFGEHNPVLALHRPLLGNNTMTNINNDHHTSSHHPHISVDKKFYAVKPAVVMSDTYGKSHEVLDENMIPYQRFLAGLNAGRVQQMETGIILKTVEGPKEITFLDTYEMAPDTQLYNLVVGGSHTYCVDGYAVTGWPNEEDFDYDAWTVKTPQPKA